MNVFIQSLSQSWKTKPDIVNFKPYLPNNWVKLLISLLQVTVTLFQMLIHNLNAPINLLQLLFSKDTKQECLLVSC
jgi:hypothetical protein